MTDDRLIERPGYLNRIHPFIGKNIIKVLVGVRRSGKSTLLRQVERLLRQDGAPASSILSMSFESSEFSHIASADDLVAHIRNHVDCSGKIRLFFDEIQEVEGWERALRSLMVDYDADIYVTGSNAHLLSSDLATYITGRYVSIDVYPFSFAEFVRALGTAAESVDERTAFRRYVVQGGFPFQMDLGFEPVACRQYLGDLLSTVLLKDVVRRINVRDVDQLERIVSYAMAEEGHLLTAKGIADYLKSERRRVSQETVASYLNAAQKAFLLYRAPREDIAGKRLLRMNEKCYVVDQGLRSAGGMDNLAAIDQVLEGIVFMELKRRGYEVRVGKVGEREVDFVARRGDEVEYYQVTYLLASDEVREREFGALECIRDSYPKTVLSLDELAGGRNGIRAVNLIDWLLGRD